ncbi:MAG TPA: metal ABC transporter ATP-binding protein [Solirubrobacteraceae bacterium]|nr:metal ABC transporter ATP-binding protein [Solirubrobacteraceae bacterium]
MSAPVLAVERLSVALAGRPVLREISFTIEPGEFTGLIGSNGAGKTTLLRAILGLRTRGSTTSGQVLVGGAARARRNPLIGYVPQKVQLDPDVPLRARDLVALGIDGHRLGFALPSRRRHAQVDEMLDAVGAREFAEARVGELSGGEQQRVLLAHALMGHPRLLLLDEPLANLDLRSVGEVVALIARIASEQQLAVLISAHEINPLLPVMDRILYLAGGRAVHGTVDEVVRADVLTGLYGHPVDVLHVHGRVLVVAEVAAGAGADPTAVPSGVEVVS